MHRESRRRSALLAIAVGTVVALAVWPKALVAAWNELAGLIAVEGEPVPASPAVLSEHEIQELETLPPQAQAERLLERAINHYSGATDLLAQRTDGWRGKLDMAGALNGLFMTALSGNDLRVRAAALELYLAAYEIEKTPDSLDRIMSRGDREEESRPQSLWVVGVLGNRGVDPERGLDYLLRWVDHPRVDTRQWAIEGLAMLGTNGAIGPLLRVFHDDPSSFIRERAGCGLAQSGMFTQQQRMTAVPELLAFAEDAGLDDPTREWVFQALQDITGQRLSHEARAWRAWWADRARPVTGDPS